MACFWLHSPKSRSPLQKQPILENDLLLSRHPDRRVLMRLPGCTVHLLGEGDVLEIGNDDFTLLSLLYDDGVSLATLVKVGGAVQWPLTVDEPVLKIGRLCYLFSLPMKGGGCPLNYGVTFADYNSPTLPLSDSFLSKNSCFSSVRMWRSVFSADWERITKNIEGGSGRFVKGIFKCSSAYAKQVREGGEIICESPAETYSIHRDETGPAIRASLKRYGEGAREATEDVLVTVGHCDGTLWNIFKIRKALLLIPSRLSKPH